MLDSFIIDELKRREREKRDDADRPRAEIPKDDDKPAEVDEPSKSEDDKNGSKDRGVVVIDL